jgi:serine/threonine protein kinase/Tfp pilus assembly protein PilF
MNEPRTEPQGPQRADSQRAEREGKLLRWIEECEARLVAGQAIDLDRVTAENPALRGELEECLRGLELVRRVGRGLREEHEESSARTPGSGSQDGPPGTIGDFRIIREIGRGGMGIVYEAEQISLERRVALKVLPFAAVLDPKQIQRFQLEAQAAARLSHAHIVPIFAVGCDRGLHFYAMRYVEGRVLSEVIRELRDLPAGATPPGDRKGISSSPPSSSRFFYSVARLGAQVADALEHAHSMGIVHRDIKPSNILVDASGDAWVTDFGLARMHGDSSLTLSGDVLGTLRYMSPEQARGRRNVDHRVDVYSLGVSLAEVACLEPLFDGATREEVFRLVVEKEPKRLTQRGRPLPRDLETVILKASAKDAEDRYATARDLAEDLRAVADDKPIRARRPNVLERGFKWARRHKPLAGALAACAVLAAVLGATAWRSHVLQRDVMYRDAVRDALLTAQTAELTMPLGSGWFRETVDYSEFDAIYQPRDRLSSAALDPITRGLAGLQGAIGIRPNAPAAYYHKGRLLHLTGRDEEALRELDEALQVDPRFVPARAMRALIRERRGEGRASAEDLAQGVSHSNAAWVSDWLESQRAARQGRWHEAALAYGRLLGREDPMGEIFPGSSIETLLGTGVVRLEAGDVRGAFEAFSVAKYLWPKAIAPSLFVGKALYFLRDHDAADRTFRELAEETGQHREIAREVLRLYVSLWDDERALPWIDDLEPNFERELLRVYVEFRLGVGVREQARKYLARARELVRLDPRSARAEALLAGILSISFLDRAGTREHAETAVSLAPNDYVVRFWNGMSYRVLGLEQEALRECEASLFANPNWIGSWNLRGVLCRSRGDAEGALMAIDHAIDANPTNAGSYEEYGTTLMALGRLQEAEERISEAFRLNHDGSATSLLGKVLLARGGIEAAEAVLIQGTTTYSRYVPIKLQLASLRRRRGAVSAATRLLREALSQKVTESNQAAIDLFDLLAESASPEALLAILIEGFRLFPERTSLASRLAGLVRRSGIGPRVASIDPAVRGDLDELARRVEPKPWHLHTAALFLLHDAKARDLDRAGELVRRALELSKKDVPEFLATLAEIESARGDTASAILALELASSQIDAPAELREQLEVARCNARPVAPSCVSIDAWIADLPIDGAHDAAALEEFRSRSGTPLDSPLLTYFEACVLLRNGSAAEASRVLDSCILAYPSAAPVWRRWIDAQRAAGAGGDAEKRLREHLVTHLPASPDLWTLWFRYGVGELGLEPSVLTAQIPEAAGSPARDAVWVTRELSQHGVIRINCGGGDIEPAPGEAWTHDRFFEGGQSQSDPGVEIDATDRDDVYRTHRFWPSSMGTDLGYHVPLRNGPYAVTLHFSENWWLERGFRRFDVVAEGESRIPDLDLFAASGFRVAHPAELRVEVRDGVLDLSFPARVDGGLVSGIEIRRIED